MTSRKVARRATAKGQAAPVASAAAIASLNPRSRFFRSTHLQKDFDDENALDGVIVTPAISTSTARIIDGLHPQSRRRAWRITGDYGTGKSTFAMVLARLLTPVRRSASDEAISELERLIDATSPPELWPVLIVGDRSDIRGAIVHALALAIRKAMAVSRSRPRAASRKAGRANVSRADLRSKERSGRVPTPTLEGCLAALEVQEAMGDKSPPAAEAVLALLTDATRAISSARVAQGVLLLVDEAGKFLEYSVANQEADNLFFLQMLAEESSRSGDDPLVTVLLLHQGVESYADRLPPAVQREWTKVAGRFDEILFANGIPAVTGMLAGALRPNEKLIPRKTVALLKEGMRWAAKTGWYGHGASARTLEALAPKIFPLHPTVVPPAVALARRLLQNERSLLSFVLSDESAGVLRWSEKSGSQNSTYRLSDLFDFLRAGGGVRLDGYARRAYWPRLLDVVESASGDVELEIVLKTIAILNLVEADGFFATHEAVIAATVGQVAEPANAIGRLKASGVLHDRGANAGYALWPNTSVDLGKLYARALDSLGAVDPIATIARGMPRRPIVAKRHYIDTGTLRNFAVVYVQAVDLAVDLAVNLAGVLADSEENGGKRLEPTNRLCPEADGKIVVVLCETELDRKSATAFALGAKAARKPDVLFGISQRLDGMTGLARTVEAWSLVLSDSPELGYDAFAAEEAQRSLFEAEKDLAGRAEFAAGLSSQRRVEWYRAGRRVGENETRLSVLVSDACDELYVSAPRVSNELLNRRSLSSAAAAARTRLIQGILERSDSELLGLPLESMPPEKSMYLSVFVAGRLHRRHEADTSSHTSSRWHIVQPSHNDDPLRFAPVFKHIKAIFREMARSQINVSDLFRILESAPFGIRTGLLPVILAAFTASRPGEIAFFERGTFIRVTDTAVFMRLMKCPGDFAIQWHPLDAEHRELYRMIAGALRLNELGITKQRDEPSAIVDVVQQLLRFGAKLPEFTRKTTHLSVAASRVRHALTSARDPVDMLFSQLPTAVGFDAFVRGTPPTGAQAEGFVLALRDALDCLSDAYDALLLRISRRIAESFQSDEVGLRSTLLGRAIELKRHIGDLRLRGLCLRFTDAKLDERAWIESIGSFVIEKPPNSWNDQDEVAFAQEIHAMGGKFVRAELAQPLAASLDAAGGLAAHLSVTTSEGAEESYRIAILPEDRVRVSALTARLTEALGQIDSIALAAISNVLLDAGDRLRRFGDSKVIRASADEK